MGKRIEYPLYDEAQKAVQKAGIKTIVGYRQNYKKLKLPSDPAVYYRGKGWSNWDTFLEKKELFISYDKAKELVQKKGIKSRREYDLNYTVLDLPSAPSRTYKGKGWVDWDSFLGKETFPTYEEARQIVKENGIKDKEEYLLSYEKLRLPKNPNRTYKGKGWKKWDYFFGKYPTYEEARTIIKKSGIKTKREYDSSRLALGLPSDPKTYYKEEGWVSWVNFLVKTPKVSPEERKYNILTKLFKFPSLLNEDTPLQIIYLIVSQVDKHWAKEIEVLLGNPSSEGRLNWVKEQLRKLKGGVTIKSKKLSKIVAEEISETTIDDFEVFPEELSEEEPYELSIMESILDNNEDVIEALSEEKMEKIKTSWDNYIHSVVNRNLIKKYDG